MNRLRATYDVAWWWLHRWRIGLPLLLVLAGMIGWSSAVPKTYGDRDHFYRMQGLEPPPPPLLERIWVKIGLPVTVWPSWGFMGHGGYYLPRVFVRSAALGLVWSLLALVSWLMHRREYERTLREYEAALRKERSPAPRLSRQLALGLLRLVAVSCGMVVLYIAAGRLIAIVLFPLLLLYFLLLMLYGLGRLAVRGIRGAAARRHAGESGPPGSVPDATELHREHGAGDGEKIA